jgi:hypothetical protein
MEGKNVGGEGCSWRIVECYSGLVIHMNIVVYKAHVLWKRGRLPRNS